MRSIKTVVSFFLFILSVSCTEVAIDESVVIPGEFPGGSPIGGGEAPVYCGGSYNKECGEGSFCDTSASDDFECNAEGLVGVCVEIPSVCPNNLKPVCGCDGETYANDCLRITAAVSLAYEGDCEAEPREVPVSLKANEGESCGGVGGAECESGLFCDTSASDNFSCDADDLAGVCVAIPDLCPINLLPVCGCDGETYPNDCARKTAGVALAAMGACEGSAGEEARD